MGHAHRAHRVGTAYLTISSAAPFQACDAIKRGRLVTPVLIRLARSLIMQRRYQLIITFLLSAFGLSQALAQEEAGQPIMRADIRGEITSLQQAKPENDQNNILGLIRIEGTLEEDTQYDQAAVTITDKTLVFEKKAEKNHPVTFESLAIGQRVQVRFIGPVMESYPVRATASEVVILSKTKE